MLSISEALRRLPNLTIPEMATVIDSYDRRTSRESSKPKSNDTYLVKKPESQAIFTVAFKEHETLILEVTE